jgi:cytochrome c oxidase subunit 2
MIKWGALGFQNGMSWTSIQTDEFHDYILFFLLIILFVVGGLLLRLMLNTFQFKFLLEFQGLEFVWTLLPGGILLFLGGPRLKLLYSLETVSSPSLVVKVIGHQWYWSYDYSDFAGVDFDSYMLPLEDLGQFRLLDVDNRVVVPTGVLIRFIIRAADVLHSWAVPSLGLKVDAVPGRLNQIFTSILTRGLFFGQCSEICGANHRFMPIVLEAVPRSLFKRWILTFA